VVHGIESSQSGTFVTVGVTVAVDVIVLVTVRVTVTVAVSVKTGVSYDVIFCVAVCVCTAVAVVCAVSGDEGADDLLQDNIIKAVSNNTGITNLIFILYLFLV